MVAAVLPRSACCCLKEPRKSSSFLCRLLISMRVFTFVNITVNSQLTFSNIHHEITSKSVAAVAVITKLTFT